MATKARDFHKPGYAGYRYTYAETASSLSGLPLENVRALYRALVAQHKAGDPKAEVHLPLVLQVGLGLAMAEEADLAYGHSGPRCACSTYDRCHAARVNDARRAGTHNGAIRAMHRAYND